MELCELSLFEFSGRGAIFDLDAYCVTLIVDIATLSLTGTWRPANVVIPRVRVYAAYQLVAFTVVVGIVANLDVALEFVAVLIASAQEE